MTRETAKMGDWCLWHRPGNASCFNPPVYRIRFSGPKGPGTLYRDVCELHMPRAVDDALDMSRSVEVMFRMRVQCEAGGITDQMPGGKP